MQYCNKDEKKTIECAVSQLTTQATMNHVRPTDTKMQRRNRQLKLKITQPKSRTLQSFAVPSPCLDKPIIVTFQQFHKNQQLLTKAQKELTKITTKPTKRQRCSRMLSCKDNVKIQLTTSSKNPDLAEVLHLRSRLGRKLGKPNSSSLAIFHFVSSSTFQPPKTGPTFGWLLPP